MSYLWHRHKRLLTGAIIISTLVLLIGIVCVVDSIQKQNRRDSLLVGNPIRVIPDSEVKSYNVEGMTDEEIKKMLEDMRGR